MESSPLPRFLVIGAPRSGTTTVANHLRAHPDVFVPEAKELFFFTSAGRNVDDYRRYFADAGERIPGEATPLYLADREAPKRMASLVPDARLVAILREPVSRALSHYWYRRALATEHRSFEQAIADEVGDRQPALDARYIEVGQYADQIDRVLEHYPAEALHLVLFDDLRSDLDGTLEGIFAHIGVDPSRASGEIDDVHNASYCLRSYPLHHFLWRTRLYLRMPKRLAFAIHALNERPMPEVDPALLGDLHDRFADSNARVAERLGRALPWSR